MNRPRSCIYNAPTRRRPCWLACLVALPLALTAVLAGDAAAAEILVGMSAAFSGPVGKTGQQMRIGIESAFGELNASGRLAGESLRLVALDDGYEPHQAAANVRRLIDQGVVAILGNVGTPTAVVTEPIARKLYIPFVAAYSGADQLRHRPADRYVFHLRASYAEEARALVDHALKTGIHPDEVALFTQRDAFGDAVFEGALTALVQRGLSQPSQLLHTRYERNTLNVEMALAEMLGSERLPRAVIMGSATEPSVRFIELARLELPDMMFLHVSFGADEGLAKALEGIATSVIAAQVVPDPTDAGSTFEAYRSALAIHAPTEAPNRISLEGYFAGRLLGEAIAAAARPVGREAVADSLENSPAIDLGGGREVRFDRDTHQATHDVWLTRLSGGRIEALVNAP